MNALLNLSALNYCAVVEHHQAVCTLGQEKVGRWRWLPKQLEIVWDRLSWVAARVWTQEALHYYISKRDFLLALALECTPALAQSSLTCTSSLAGWEQSIWVTCALSTWSPLQGEKKADTPSLWHKCYIADATTLNIIGRSISVLKGPWKQTICAQIAGRPGYVLMYNVSDNAQLTFPTNNFSSYSFIACLPYLIDCSWKKGKCLLTPF